MNKIELIGRLCADPEMRYTQAGKGVCAYRIAVNRRYKNKQTGAYDADFISCQSWDKTAEFVSKHFAKGSQIAVIGSLQNNDYTDQSGVKHHAMVVVVDEVYFTGGKQDAQQNGAQQPPQAPQQQQAQQYGAVPNVPYSEPQASASEHRYANDVQPQQTANLGDLSGFEDILSDGDVPF